MSKEKAGSVIDEIRSALRKGGKDGKGKGLPNELLFVQVDGVKVVRFLADATNEETTKVVQHDKYGEFMPQPCFRYYGKKCPFCDLGGKYKTRTFYAWTVYDYESQQKRIFLAAPSQNSALDDLIEIFEKNGTLKDRDLRIIRVASGDNKSRYKVREVQGEPTPYKVPNKKNPFSQDKIFSILRGTISQVKPKAVESGIDDDAPISRSSSDDDD